MSEKNVTDWTKLVLPAFCGLLLLVILLSCDSPTENSTVAVKNKLLIYSDVASMPTNGGTARILAKVYSGSDTSDAVSNVHVQFSASLGTVQVQNGTTDGRGYARATAFPNRHTGKMGITASIENYSNTIFVSVIQGPSLLSANPPEILADGSSRSMISATVLDSLGQAVSGAAVQFSTTSGTITVQSFADNKGNATATLTSIASERDVTASISARSDAGKAVVVEREGEHIARPAAVQSSLGSTTVVFKGITITCTPAKKTVYANESDSTTVDISVRETTSGAAVEGATLTLSTNLGQLRAKQVTTDASGNASAVFYGSSVSGVATVRAAISDQLSASTEITLAKQLSMTLACDARSLIANGNDTVEIRVQIIDSHGNPLPGETVSFSTSLGAIPASALTDLWGYAKVNLLSASSTGVATVKVKCQEMEKSFTIDFTESVIVPPQPRAIQLILTPNIVGVKRTGQNEALQIKAEVKSELNNPITEVAWVQFELIGGLQYEDTEVLLTPQGEKSTVSAPVPTVNGVASAYFHSGTRAGTMRVKATLVDSTGTAVLPQLSSEISQFQVLAGPAFLDMSDLNDPFTGSRMSIAGSKLNIFAGELNTAASVDTVTVLVGDRYNNPAQKNTAVYFTTTGGIITSETGFTDSNGLASVYLYNGNPYPKWSDPFTIPNPNAPLGGPSTFTVPGFDFDGDGKVNEGVAIITAYTEGVDQEGRQVKVWRYLPVVFSQRIYRFEAVPASTTLLNGRSTIITVTIQDINGNPMVGGSTLEFYSRLGTVYPDKIATRDPGSTHYSAVLTNTLDPKSGTPGYTEVRVTFKGANGEATILTVPIYMDTNSE